MNVRLSKRNRRGVWGLIVGLIVIVCAPRIFHSMAPNEVEFSEEKLNYAEEVIQQKSRKQQKVFPKKKSVTFKRPTQAFDPNDYSKSEWMKLGVSEKQADVIVRFCQRGVFSNEDLQRIYVLPEQLFDLIKDSTHYPKKEVAPVRDTKSEFVLEKKALFIDVNSASEEELIQLSGIGPFFAKKIVEQRIALGGYHQKEQLLDIWKFDQEKLNKIEESIHLGNQPLKKININSCSVEELKSHPYISWNVANSIVKLRSKFSKYSNYDQLLESVLIDKELLAKVKPYLAL